MLSAVPYALSLKQPWAALLVHGRKTIEVRRWATPRRGRILIHAARVSDERPEAWALVPDELRQEAQLVGGLVGSAELVGCVPYTSLQSFAADQVRHLNPSAWFQLPKLYGFIFRNPVAEPFRRYPGWVKFFPVREMNRIP